MTKTITPDEQMEQAQQNHRVTKVALVRQLNSVSSNYRVELDPQAAEMFYQGYPEYNSMKDLDKLVPAINALVPRIEFGKSSSGWPNPNNGKFAHHFEVGNEGGAVLYIYVAKFYQRGKNFDYKALAVSLAQLAVKHGADEYTVLNDYEGDDVNSNFVFRIWWD